QPRHDQVAPLDVGMGRPGAQGAGAGVPAEVVQLVADVRHVDAPDDRAVGRRAGGEVDHRDAVGTAVAVRAHVERRDVGELLCRTGDGTGGGGVEGRVWTE